MRHESLDTKALPRTSLLAQIVECLFADWNCKIRATSPSLRIASFPFDRSSQNTGPSRSWDFMITTFSFCVVAHRRLIVLHVIKWHWVHNVNNYNDIQKSAYLTQGRRCRFISILLVTVRCVIVWLKSFYLLYFTFTFRKNPALHTSFRAVFGGIAPNRDTNVKWSGLTILWWPIGLCVCLLYTEFFEKSVE